MAQSAITVTPPNPTPPTNFASVYVGTTPPTAPSQPVVDDGVATTTTLFAVKAASVDNANFPSVDAEGRGTEVVNTQSYNAAVYNPNGPLVTVSTGGGYTTTPNASHASYLSGPTVPTITSCSAGGTAGSGTTLLTVTGTGFLRNSVVWVDGVAQNTNYVSATSLTVTNAPKKATAGTRSVTVVNGNGPTSAAGTWTFT